MPGLAAVSKPPAFTTHWDLGLADSVADLAWTGDGTALLVGDASGELQRLDHNGTTLACWLGHQAGVTRVCLQPGNDAVVASAGEDGRVVLWDSVAGTELSLLADQGGWVEQLTWTPNGQVIAAAASKSISLWRGDESLGIWYDGRRQILAMDWAPDNQRLATASNKGLYLWRLDHTTDGDAEPMQLLSFPGAPVAVAWQPNGRALAVGTQDGFLQIWRQGGAGKGPRGNTQASQLTMKGYPGKVVCLAWHPTRPMIATAGGPDVVLWQLPQTAKGAKGQQLRHHQRTVTVLAWSPDGQRLASGDRAGRLCIWSADGQLLFSQDLAHEVSTLAWRPGCDALAVGDTRGRLRLLVDSGSDSDSTKTTPVSGDNA